MKTLENYYWYTSYAHRDNTHTMYNFLEEHLFTGFEIIEHDGTYAEIKSKEGIIYGVHASGNGDFFNHKVEFEIISNE